MARPPAPRSSTLAFGFVLALAFGTGACGTDPGSADPVPELEFLAGAEQAGPVAYRDPPGAVSPDGRWLAYVERERVHFVPVDGGAARVVDTGMRSVRYLTWLPDSRSVAARGIASDVGGPQWRLFDRGEGGWSRLWPDRAVAPAAGSLDQLAWSPDGAWVAGVARSGGRSSVWVLDAAGQTAEERASGARLSGPAWTPDGRLACLSMEAGVQTVRLPCAAAEPLFSDQEAYGGIAFSPDGGSIYYGSPGAGGFLDLWSRPLNGGAPRRLTHFARDAYDPSVAVGGRVVFRTQDYRTFLATVPAGGGPSTPVTTFQSETPTWSPDGRLIAFTFGSWRHVTDDIHYPDIAQEIGVVSSAAGLPHAAPEEVIRQSDSEDQGMVWSPNGRWIAFHTHVDSDDVWLMPSDGSGEARMISQGGDETGWPRWSPDGRWIVFTSYREGEDGSVNSHLFLIGIDQETGTVTMPPTRIDLGRFPHEIIHGEWANAGETLVFEAVEELGRKSLWAVPRSGGVPTRFHRFGSDQLHSGIGVSPDGRWAAYIDREPSGYFQVFRVPVGGGTPQQLTSDPTHKTQPSYAPTGDRIAFTVFRYESAFWRIRP